MTAFEKVPLLKVPFLLLLPLLILTAGVHSAQAQTADPPVLKNEAVVDFPNTTTFRLELDSSLTVTEAVLTYNLGVNSCIDAGTRVSVDEEDLGGGAVEWTWIMSRSGNPPPGASLWWEWTITDSSGNTFTTPRKELLFEDERFEWRTVTADNIRLHWYEGDDVGPTLLDAAVAGLAQLESDVGIELNDDVQIFIYGNSADMRDAVLYIQDWAGGVAFSGYNIILIGVEPAIVDSWGVPTVRHELAHLVIGRFGESCLGGSRPNWLNEGLAVYAEGEPDNSVVTDLDLAIDNNTFFPVRSLNGTFPSHNSGVNLAYSQSYSLVNFLLESYGPEKMQELLLTLAAAAGYDEALEQVYGFNTDGLETAWRESIGAPSREIPPTPTAISAAAVPTYVPLNGVQSVPTQGPAGPNETPETAVPDPTSAVSESTPPPGSTPTGGETAVAAQPLTPDPASPTPETQPPTPTPQPDNSISVCGIGAAPIMGLAFLFIGRSKKKRHEK